MRALVPDPGLRQHRRLRAGCGCRRSSSRSRRSDRGAAERAPGHAVDHSAVLSAAGSKAPKPTRSTHQHHREDGQHQRRRDRPGSPARRGVASSPLTAWRRRRAPARYGFGLRASAARPARRTSCCRSGSSMLMLLLSGPWSGISISTLSMSTFYLLVEEHGDGLREEDHDRHQQQLHARPTGSHPGRCRWRHRSSRQRLSLNSVSAMPRR